ncbi:Krev interaction trapped protein 1 [Gaertneriomyces sp. JEL0708]|nr:Krev interaction trapped protein 1 [Gaertneriomyces sp. JEL0708]
MGVFKKSKKNKLDRRPSNPLLLEQQQALQRRNPAKQVIETAPEAAREAQWQPPLQRHIKPDDGSEFVTIRVRILNGDAEHDFNAKFPAGTLPGQKVCDIIAEREGVHPDCRSMFALWVVSKDLELQIRPDLDIFSIMNKWNTLVLNYTHYPEAIDPNHPINRHWFVYRREATLTKRLERLVTHDPTVRLLYGEAKRNVMTGRYVCTVEDAIVLAGIQTSLVSGSYDRARHPDGYLINNDFWKTLIPARLHDEHKPGEWEAAIRGEHSKHVGKEPAALRQAYVEYTREWACYGCAFFPCCKDRPPAGFFEFRLQRWQIGISTDGCVVLDQDKNGYAFAKQWDDVVLKHSSDRIIIRWKENDKMKKLKLFTPQAPMIHNLALRAKYLALKGVTEEATTAVQSAATTRKSVEANNAQMSQGVAGYGQPPDYTSAMSSRRSEEGSDNSVGAYTSVRPAQGRTRASSFHAPIPEEYQSVYDELKERTSVSNGPGAQPTASWRLAALDEMVQSAVADLDSFAPSGMAPSAPSMDDVRGYPSSQPTAGATGVMRRSSTGPKPLGAFASSRRPSMQTFQASSLQSDAPASVETPPQRPVLGAFGGSRHPSQNGLAALGAFGGSRHPSQNGLAAFMAQPKSVPEPPQLNHTAEVTTGSLYATPSGSRTQIANAYIASSGPSSSSYVAESSSVSVVTHISRDQSAPRGFPASASFDASRRGGSQRGRRPSFIDAIGDAFKDTGVRRGADAAPNYAAAFETYL